MRLLFVFAAALNIALAGMPAGQERAWDVADLVLTNEKRAGRAA
jgi:hypothetical protein